MSHHHKKRPSTVERLREFSVPLLAGVVVAMIVANINFDAYEHLVHSPFAAILGGGHGAVEATTGAELHASPWDHYTTLHFLVNDLFMVLFFGVAAKEITEACLPGGALNPPKKAINPLLGTLGGVLGPAFLYILLNKMMGEPAWQRGWGIPTATDIALAWLAARFIFGKAHPAVSFLLLLAVADDGIGLGIIAFAYPDANHPTQWSQALWILPGMAIAFALRAAKVRSWIPYIALGGAFSWWGLFNAHLHPALALVFIVPFLPGPRRDLGMFEDKKDESHLSTLEQFEHDVKAFVDFGLFFFAFANAGVPLAGITNLTWIVLLALVLGKILGISTFSFVGQKLGFPLPTGMTTGHLIVASAVAGMGLTVALFVSGQAFTDGAMQGAAKMGALFSVVAAPVAFALRQLLLAKTPPAHE